MRRGGGKRQRRHASHAAKATDAASPTHANQHGLGLIIQRMRGKDVIGPQCAGKGREQSITCDPRGLLQPGFRLLAAPAQSAVSHAQPARQTFHRACFGRRFRAQSMIDRHSDEGWSCFASSAPARRQDKKRSGVGASGDRQDEGRSPREWFKELVRLGRGNRLRILSSGHASVLARPPVLPRPTPAEICARPHPGRRRPLPSHRAPQAIGQVEAAHPAPADWLQIWSRR